MSAARTRLAALAAFALFPLAGCSDDPEPAASDTGAAMSDRTLAATLAARPELSKMAGALSATGLSSAFDGPGSYTILAPTDEAFAALGARGEALMTEDQQAILVAILRDHMLPGNLGPDAIRTAIETQGGPVEMTTLGEGAITFSIEGETMRAVGEGGSEGAILGEAIIASNGAVIPIAGFVGGVDPAAAGAEADSASAQ